MPLLHGNSELAWPASPSKPHAHLKCCGGRAGESLALQATKAASIMWRLTSGQGARSISRKRNLDKGWCHELGTLMKSQTQTRVALFDSMQAQHLLSQVRITACVWKIKLKSRMRLRRPGGHSRWVVRCPPSPRSFCQAPPGSLRGLLPLPLSLRPHAWLGRGGQTAPRPR